MKKPETTQLELDHQRLKKQEQLLRKDMGKQRIKQLKMANEDEDKTIHRLEKLLKIDKSKGKNKKRGIPRMFNDGLDYALEMCLPENIEKMYAAAKEAADAEQERSDSEWQEDFAMATGDIDQLQSSSTANSSKKNNPNKPNAKDQSKSDEKTKKRYERLREIEAKYFGDELASDLSDVDSEFERSAGESEELSDNDEHMGSDDEDDDDSAPEEIATNSKSSKKRQLEKSVRKQTIAREDDEDEDEDEDDEDEDDDESMDSSNAEDDSNESMGSENGDYDDSDGSEMDKKPEIWEDIYGRKRDKDGNVITEHGSERLAMGATPANADGKYIPPHQRARLAAAAAAEASKAGAASAESETDPKRIEKLMRLKRLLKGHLNRLSEANMHKIATELDNLYMQNARHDMNTTLSALICDALISSALAPERMVMEHAMLIAALHANVGTEVGANLLESLVDRFHQMIEAGIEQYDVEDKTLDNIVFILCHMYTFKVSTTAQGLH